MARAPRWKVYDGRGYYQAATKEIEAAAAVVSIYGPGATIREGHLVVWTEERDGYAGNSYDEVVTTVKARLRRNG